MYLVVLKRSVALVQVEDVVRVVYSEDTVGGVPVDVEGLGVVAHHGVYIQGEQDEEPLSAAGAPSCWPNHLDKSNN